jgi:hypothetical protein
MYKTLTGIITRRISTHLEEQNLLPAEQKGCHPGSKSCKKAFDSVPCSWAEKSIESI